MRLPNGYGSVYKLSGNRRKPYIARKTIGWDIDMNTRKSSQKYATIGYYATRKEALAALAAYNADPYDLDAAKITFREVYERWYAEFAPTTGESNAKSYRTAWTVCQEIADMRFVDVKLSHLQGVIDHSGKNTPALRRVKILFKAMYKYAVIHELIPEEKVFVKYVDISKPGNPNALVREPFSSAEIKALWSAWEDNTYITIILIMIYTGCRISELLELEKSNVDLQTKCFHITESKTEAGIRTVPIANKVLPFFQRWYETPGKFLFSSSSGLPFTYLNFLRNYWNPIMKKLGMQHFPHDTRHTCVSLLTAAKVDERVIRRIVGHSGQGVTETVYTHFELQPLLDAINLI